MTAPNLQWVDAGHGVRYAIWHGHHHLYYTHGCPVLGGNPSAIAFDVPENDYVPAEGKWQVESWEPITLSPSLLCTACGHHGFLRNGQWEPC